MTARLLPLLAVASLGLAAQGCIIVTDDTPSCTTDLRNYSITLDRYTPTTVYLADVVSVQACENEYCSMAGAPDASGYRNFGSPTDTRYPRGQLSISDSGTGQLRVSAVYQMIERQTYSNLTVKVTTRTGAVVQVTGGVGWSWDGCHSAPTSPVAS